VLGGEGNYEIQRWRVVNLFTGMDYIFSDSTPSPQRAELSCSIWDTEPQKRIQKIENKKGLPVEGADHEQKQAVELGYLRTGGV